MCLVDSWVFHIQCPTHRTIFICQLCLFWIIFIIQTRRFSTKWLTLGLSRHTNLQTNVGCPHIGWFICLLIHLAPAQLHYLSVSQWSSPHLIALWVSAMLCVLSNWLSPRCSTVDTCPNWDVAPLSVLPLRPKGHRLTLFTVPVCWARFVE